MPGARALPALIALLGACGEGAAEPSADWAEAAAGRSVAAGTADDLEQLAALPLFVREEVPPPDIFYPYRALFRRADAAAAVEFVRARTGPLVAEHEVQGFVGGERWQPRPQPPACGVASLGIRAATTVQGYHLGAILWQEARARDLAASVWMAGRPLSIDDPRRGPVVLPAAYFDQVDLTVPSRVRRWQRQAALLHEARHGDCGGGGLTEAAAAFIRTRADRSRQLEDLPDLACCWPHAKCRQGPLSGLEVCDRVPWGAYSVQLVFLRAVADQVPMSRREARHLSATIDEVRLHLEGFEVMPMLIGELGPPDLSHTPRRVPPPRPG